MIALRRIDCAEARERAPFFVLDALEAREMAEVREHLRTCPHEHPEFAELGGVVPYLAISVEPSDGGPELRTRVMAAIAADRRAAERDDAVAERLIASFGTERRVAPVSTTAADTPASDVPASDTTASGTTASDRTASGAPSIEATDSTGTSVARPATAPGRPTTLWVDEPGGRLGTGVTPPVSLADRANPRAIVQRWLLPAVAVLLIGVLGAWNLSLTQQADDAAHRSAELRTAVAIATAPGTRVARLSGDATAPNVGGFAAFRSDGTGVLVLEGLAPAPSGRTYQAWYMADGQPRSAGLVKVHADGLAIATGLQPSGPIDAVALTVEPAGGSPQPTTAPFVLGTFTS